MADYLVEYSCDAKEKRALVRVILSHDEELQPTANRMRLEDLPQYVSGESPKVFCSFSNHTFGIKGGMSNDHPRNNNVGIFLDSVREIGWSSFTGDETFEISTDHSGLISVKYCDNDATGGPQCGSTKFAPKSNSDKP